MTKLAIVGSRTFKNKELFDKTLSEWISQYGRPSCIVSGGAEGADKMAAAWANENNIKLVEFIPDYKTHESRAPLLRNTDIVKASDFVIAFVNLTSRGTWDSIRKAEKFKKPCIIIMS